MLIYIEIIHFDTYRIMTFVQLYPIIRHLEKYNIVLKN